MNELNKIKILKEKLKKKNEKTRELNRKNIQINEIFGNLLASYRRIDIKYQEIKKLLPIKYYKVSYEVISGDEVFLSRNNELKKGSHPSEIIAELHIFYGNQYYIQLTDILEVAS